MSRVCITGTGFDEMFGIPTSYQDFLHAQITLKTKIEQYVDECSQIMQKNPENIYREMSRVAKKVKYQQVREANLILVYLMYFKKDYMSWSELEAKLQAIHIYFSATIKKCAKDYYQTSKKLTNKDLFYFLKKDMISSLDSENLSEVILRESFYFRRLYGKYIELLENKVEKVVTQNRLKQAMKSDLRKYFFMQRDVDSTEYKQTEIVNFNNSNFFAKYLYTNNNYREMSRRYIVSVRDDKIEEKIFGRRLRKQQSNDQIDFSDYLTMMENMHLKRITKMHNVDKDVKSVHIYYLHFSKYDYLYMFEVFDQIDIINASVDVYFYYDTQTTKIKEFEIEINDILRQYLHSHEQDVEMYQNAEMKAKIKIRSLEKPQVNISKIIYKHCQAKQFDLLKKLK